MTEDFLLSKLGSPNDGVSVARLVATLCRPTSGKSIGFVFLFVFLLDSLHIFLPQILNFLCAAHSFCQESALSPHSRLTSLFCTITSQLLLTVFTFVFVIVQGGREAGRLAGRGGMEGGREGGREREGEGGRWREGKGMEGEGGGMEGEGGEGGRERGRDGGRGTRGGREGRQPST